MLHQTAEYGMYNEHVW